MNSNVWSLDIDEASIRTNVLIVLPGQAGCNQARMYIDMTNPDEVPNVKLLAIDADGALLLERFQQDPKWQSYNTEGCKRDDPDANLKKWQESGRLKVIHLRKKDRSQKSFGAGGRPQIGQEILQEWTEDIKQELAGQDLVIIWAAGGGGTGTPSAEHCAKLAKEAGIHVQSILIIPERKMAEKLAIAHTLRTTLRKCGPTQIIRNDDFAEDKNIPKSEFYKQVNRYCMPLLQALVEVTQVTGTSDNIDTRDIWTGAELGPDLLGGRYTADGETAEVAEIVTALTAPAQQPTGLNAKAIFLLYRGPWKLDMMDQIELGVQEATNFPHDKGLFKIQTNEKVEDLTVSLLAYGTFDKPSAATDSVAIEIRETERSEEAVPAVPAPHSIPSPTVHREQSPVQPAAAMAAVAEQFAVSEAPTAQPSTAATPVRVGGKPVVQRTSQTETDMMLRFKVNGDEVVAKVPRSLSERYKRAVADEAVSQDDLGKIFDEIEAKTERRPDLPERFCEKAEEPPKKKGGGTKGSRMWGMVRKFTGQGEDPNGFVEMRR